MEKGVKMAKQTLSGNVSELDLNDSTTTARKVVNRLRNNPTKYYSVGGFMTEDFGVLPRQITKSFTHWEKPHTKLYSRITTILQNLEEKQMVRRVKKGKAWCFFWIAPATFTDFTNDEYMGL